MWCRKWEIGAAVGLMFAASITAGAVLAQKQRSETDPTQVKPRPSLKKEWAGRWQSNPFAETTSIEIRAGRTYRLKDPRKIAALMNKLTIRAFHNGMAQDFPMIARLAFDKKDGTTAFVWIGEGGLLSGLGGEMYIDPAFLTALGRKFPMHKDRRSICSSGRKHRL